MTMEKNCLTAKLEERDREIVLLKEIIAKNSSELSKEQVTALIEDMVISLLKNYHLSQIP